MDGDSSAADRRFQDFLRSAADRLERTVDTAPWESAAQNLSGTGARTGFGRRLFSGDYDTTWDDRVPYPQVVPSQTTDDTRPRTLAMGYDPQSRIIMTTFRDGTVWQYYNCSPEEWAGYSSDPSPGRYIREVLDAHPYGRAPDKYQD